MTTYIADDKLDPQGYYQITSLATAKSIAGGNGRLALIQCLGQNVRWRDDGTDPTSTVGIRLHAGESFWYTGDIKKFRVIEETTGAEVNVSTYQ
jgi:hypothetical protein